MVAPPRDILMKLYKKLSQSITGIVKFDELVKQDLGLKTTLSQVAHIPDSIPLLFKPAHDQVQANYAF